MLSSTPAVLKAYLSESVATSFIKGDISVWSKRFMGQNIYSTELERHEIYPKFIGSFSQSNESKRVAGKSVS